ncbi:MAG: hypothetical protein L6R41_008439 [Letrouitia leprolyta]|nr:MAG: hypothetical protein L6R41_008439 [Letrouitia leprolyta]
MHYSTVTAGLNLTSTTVANPLHFFSRNASHSDGKCSNGQKPPYADAPLCFYDYESFVCSFSCHSGTPNFDYCAAAIDIVCSTFAFNVSASDSDPYQSLIGTGQGDAQGADCYAQAANDKDAITTSPTKSAFKLSKPSRDVRTTCNGAPLIRIAGLAVGKPVDENKSLFVLGTTRAFFSGNGAPQAGPAPGLKPRTSEDVGPSTRPNEAKPLAANSRGSASNAASTGAGRGVSAGRGVYLGAG